MGKLARHRPHPVSNAFEKVSIYPFKINKEWEDQKTKDVWETKGIAVLLTLLCVPQAEQYFLHPLGLGMSLS